MVNSEYSGKQSLAIIQDGSMYILYVESSPEMLNKRLGEEKPIARYDGVNPEGVSLIHRALSDISAGREVDLEDLLE